MRSQKLPKWLLYAVVIIVFVGISGVIGYFSGSGQEQWYQGLQKPPLQPPGVAFGIVWPILYALMAVALVRIWQQEKTPQRSKALILFGVQLVFNYGWSFIFFGAEQLVASWVWITITLVLVFLTIRAFAKLDGLAAKLLWPYLAWLCFAFYLNSGVMLLNI